MESEAYWSAARLLYSLSSAAAKLTTDERISYMLGAVAALKHVDKKLNPGALALEVRTSFRFVLNMIS